MSNRKRQLNAFLIFSGLALLGWLMIDDVRKKREQAASEIGIEKAKDITSLTLIRQQGSTLQFHRSGEDWSMLRPVYAPANPEEIDRLTAFLALKPDNCQAADQLDLSSLGLMPPQFTLELPTQRIDIGNHDALNTVYYVKTRHGVCPIASSYFSNVAADSGQFVYPYISDPKRVLTDVFAKGNRLKAELETWQQTRAAGVQGAGTTEDCTSLSLIYGDTEADVERFALCRRGGGDFALVPERAAYEFLLEPTSVQSLGLSNLEP